MIKQGRGYKSNLCLTMGPDLRTPIKHRISASSSEYYPAEDQPVAISDRTVAVRRGVAAEATMLCYDFKLWGPGYRITNAVKRVPMTHINKLTNRCHCPVAPAKTRPTIKGTENARAPAHHALRQTIATVPPKIPPMTNAWPTRPTLMLTAQIPYPPSARPITLPANKANKQIRIPIIIRATLIQSQIYLPANSAIAAKIQSGKTDFWLLNCERPLRPERCYFLAKLAQERYQLEI